MVRLRGNFRQFLVISGSFCAAFVLIFGGDCADDDDEDDFDEPAAVQETEKLTAEPQPQPPSAAIAVTGIVLDLQTTPAGVPEEGVPEGLPGGENSEDSFNSAGEEEPELEPEPEPRPEPRPRPTDANGRQVVGTPRKQPKKREKRRARPGTGKRGPGSVDEEEESSSSTDGSVERELSIDVEAQTQALVTVKTVHATATREPLGFGPTSGAGARRKSVIVSRATCKQSGPCASGLVCQSCGIYIRYSGA